jgi:hypothetical protein
MTQRTTIDRQITPEELSVIRATLERAAVSPGYEPLAANLEHLRAVARCSCGCDSVDFCVYNPDRPPRPIGDGTGQTAAGGSVGIIIWGTDETVTGIEVYDLGAGDDDLRLPVPSSIRPW